MRFDVFTIFPEAVDAMVVEVAAAGVSAHNYQLREGVPVTARPFF